MSEQPKTEQDLSPQELGLADLLGRRRPLPAAQFRGDLARRLTDLDPGWGPRPERLLAIAGGYLCLGFALVGLAALVGLGVL